MKSALLAIPGFALLAAGILASGFTRDDPVRSATQAFGPKLTDALGIVFNDPVLTSASKFGPSRDPLVNSHRAAVDMSQPSPQWTPSQADLMKLRGQIRSKGFQVEEGLFSPRMDVWAVQKPAGHTLFPEHYSTFVPTGRQPSGAGDFGKAVYQEAKNGSKTFKRDNYWIYAAPIRFKHPQCLSCHSGAKLNDTACVVAFAFRKQ